MTRTVVNVALALGNSFPALLILRVTMVSVITLAAVRIARNTRASIRHMILAAGFAAVLALPIASMVVPRFEIKLPLQQNSPVATAEFNDRVLSGDNNSIVAHPGTTRTGTWNLSASFMAASIWTVGAILFMLPVIAGLWQLAKIRRRGLPWFRGDAVLQELRGEAHIKRPVSVVVYESVPGPLTCGVFRPVIAFPPGVDSWNEHDLRRAMIHELEHVRRYDCLTHLMSRIACALYWFHPLVWMSWRKLELEAERTCDDVVLSRANAAEYAEQLVTLARAIQASAKAPLLAMANRSDLRARVASVLDSDRRRGRPGMPCVVAVVAFSIFLTTGISPIHAVGVARPRTTVQEPDDRPEFEAASIKPKGPFKGPAMIGVQFLPGGFLRAENAYLGLLISFAYRVSEKQLDLKNIASQRGFAELMTEVFDIEAKAGINEPPSTVAPEVRRHQHGLMVQRLLADRFKLVLHKETREVPLYALVVAPNGPRLKPSPAGRTCPTGTRCGNLEGGPARGVKGLDVPIPVLVSTLTNFGDRDIVDRTGIEGRFDIDLPPWSRPWMQPIHNDQERPEDPNDPTIFTVLQQTLGLRLESIKGPRDIYVIDHIERPTPN